MTHKIDSLIIYYQYSIDCLRARLIDSHCPLVRQAINLDICNYIALVKDRLLIINNPKIYRCDK